MKPWQLGEGDNTVASEQLRMEFIFDSINRQLAAIGVTDQTTFDVFANYIGYTTGGTPSYQDMQVAWTPSNVTLADKLGFISQFNDPNALPGITSLHFKQSVSSDGLSIQGCPDLTSVTIDWTSVGTGLTINACPLLVSFTAASIVTSEQQLKISNCPLLTSLSFPSLTGQDYSAFTFTGLGLDAASVNGILAMLVAIPTWPNGGVTVDTSGGTSAAPTGQGILDKATLNGRVPGCAITN